MILDFETVVTGPWPDPTPNRFYMKPSVRHAELMDVRMTDAAGVPFALASIDTHVGYIDRYEADSPVDRVIAKNVLHSEGRFCNVTWTADANSFVDPNTEFSPSNGGTINGDKRHYYDSSTYGGASPADDPAIDLLFNAMGLTEINKKKFPSFAMVEVIGGDKAVTVQDDGVSRSYKIYKTVYPVSTYYTSSVWIRALNASIAISCTFRDDVLIAPNDYQSILTFIQPEDGWVHIQSVITSKIGYGYPLLVYHEANANAQMALPYIARQWSHVSKESHRVAIA